MAILLVFHDSAMRLICWTGQLPIKFSHHLVWMHLSFSSSSLSIPTTRPLVSHCFVSPVNELPQRMYL